MLVIGIDPGTAITGYGLVRIGPDGELSPSSYGVITTAASLPMPQRLLALHTQLGEIIRLHRPESSAVEKLFFAKNSRTAMAVGQARGVVLMTLAQAGLPIEEYAPSEVKQAVAGYGNADKNQIQQMVRILLGLDDIPRPDDATDALAVAICHLHTARFHTTIQAGRRDEQ